MHERYRFFHYLKRPETIKEESSFRAKALRWKVGPYLETSRTYTLRVTFNALPTLATLVQEPKIAAPIHVKVSSTNHTYQK